jgi:saccharopine dehydrogenase-like NADP-dependent oxidoreductase
MAIELNRVAVLGLGKVGSLVATMLHDCSFQVTGMDADPRDGFPFPTKIVNFENSSSLGPLLKGYDAVVSCLPFNLNVAVSTQAHAGNLHYFDLTEDVATTTHIRKLAETSTGVMAPQCGLAPGFIGIVGAHLAKGFDELRAVELKVGALPKHPHGRLGYAFNWSAEGLINEYINDCEVIRMGQRKIVPPLEGYEIVNVNGTQLEATTTSGGLGTMCETFDGKVQELGYKTLRYLGHFDYIKFLFQELRLQEDRKALGQILKNVALSTEEDYVFVHAAAEGWRNGILCRSEFVRTYEDMEVAGSRWRAISWTTAASVAAVLEMVRDGVLATRGFLKQEDIPWQAFLGTKSGAYYTAGDRVGQPVLTN